MKKYAIIRGTHKVFTSKGVKVYEVGDEIELSDSDAKFLVHKVKVLENQKAKPKPKPKPKSDEPTIDQVKEYLTKNGIEFDDSASKEDLIALAEEKAG